MTEDDKDALREFLQGAGMVVFTVGAFILFAMIIMGWSQNQPVEEQATKVVGTYKGCDIIQWHYGPLAEYQYFLHCNNTRPVYEQ